jgi:hypothetical protein
VRNGLCDTTRPDVLKQLRDLGVELIEMRLVWWELEPESGRWDWSRTLRDIDAVLDAGLRVGMFAWFQHPPTWYDPQGKSHARLQALGSERATSVLSVWDSQTLEVYDRLLGVCAEKLKGKVRFVYNAISGDYGEVTYCLAANHYKFSPPLAPSGLYLGDRAARGAFAEGLQKQYGSIAALNDAWGTKLASFGDDLMPGLPFADAPLRQRDDCVQWATSSLLDFADRVCGLYQRHFPGIAGGLPIGFLEENIAVGQIKSRAAKLAAKYGLTARWTGCAHLGSFDRSHLLARRISSAAQFYGAPFGTEAALIITADNAANAIYESLANGAALIHDDPQNILRVVDMQKTLRPLLRVDPPQTSLALFYPLEDEMLHLGGFSWKTLVHRCAEFRRLSDYDVCDSFLIADGYLQTKTDLVFPVTTHVRKETALALAEFAAKRGRVWLYGDTQVALLHEATTLVDLAAKRGLAVQDPQTVGTTGICRCDDWRQPIRHNGPPAFTLADGGEPCYRTWHQRHESCFFPQRQSFEIRRRAEA